MQKVACCQPFKFIFFSLCFYGKIPFTRYCTNELLQSSLVKKRNSLPCLLQYGRPHIRFGLGLHPYPCLTNKNPPSGVCGKGGSLRRTRRFCRALPSIFFGPSLAPHILTKFLLAFCDIIPLSLGYNPLMSSNLSFFY